MPLPSGECLTGSCYCHVSDTALVTEICGVWYIIVNFNFIFILTTYMEFSVCIRCLVLTVAICLSTVDSLMFHLSPNHRKCLKEEIHKDVLVTGDYELSDAPGQTASLKVGFRLRCAVFGCY